MKYIFFALAAVAIMLSIGFSASFAQTSNMTISTNRTVITGMSDINMTLVNITTIPVIQKQITISQSMIPADQLTVKPFAFENLTLGGTVDLSTVQNQTIIQPAEEATSIMINQTILPFNQTTVIVGNMSKSS